ncbi:MAG: EamA family transporter [Gammaproteobacteria bacterium]|nr:MAG: EamA family transporter [Gammaproteobacteria bacterium]
MNKQSNYRSCQNKATIVGFSAILLWATLALFTSLTNDGESIPPFQLLFLSFIIGASFNTFWLFMVKKLNHSIVTAPLKAWFLGVGGLFFYHFFYFNALSYAPEVEASLIAYLWPLLIVLFSALLPNERLRWHYVVGALVAFCAAGALILLNSQADVVFTYQYITGYAFAFICALIWALYSVFNRRFSGVSSAATVGFCYAVSLLALLSHLFSSEMWVMPTLTQWIGILGLGIGPVGAAFFVWDYGIKHGNIQLLGTLSYFAPLLSTVLLVAFSDATISSGVVFGCCGIVLGAMIAVLPNRK